MTPRVPTSASARHDPRARRSPSPTLASIAGHSPVRTSVAAPWRLLDRRSPPGAVAWLARAISFVLAPHLASADPAGRWSDPGDVPLAARYQTVVVAKEDQLVMSAPRGDAPRRGSLRANARLPIFGSHHGIGCAGRWLLVGPLAWVCQAEISFSPEDVFTPPTPQRSAEGLPFRYYFVGRGGTQAYARAEFVDDAAPEQELQPGFALALVEEVSRDGETFGHTHHGQWVPMRDLVPVHASAFHGEEVGLGDEALAFGWVVDDKAVLYARPDVAVASKGATALLKFRRVALLEEKGEGAKKAYRIDDQGHWVRASALRRPRREAPPAGLAPAERWLDVDLATQTLVAYEGERPVYATLVSTGRGAQGTPTATPKGTFRIWVKLRSSTMSNVDDEEAAQTYSIEDVPYVQFFSKGVALHGAFWHQGFGHVHSHGCVNLAPLDAERLFVFTGPHLPESWSAALPTPFERGTLVRVR